MEVVRRVADRGAYSNLTLSGLLAGSNLDPRDRALASELARGTLRRLPWLDVVLAPLLRRPLGDAPPRARAALRLGAYQLLESRVPAFAAVTETVGLVTSSERGFVNAVLRRLAADPPEPPTAGTIEGISLRTGMAPWAVRELRRLVGEEAEDAAAALATPAPLTIRANPCRPSDGQLDMALADAGHQVVPGRVHPGTYRLPRGGDPARLRGFAEGWFAIQDEASAWVVDVLDPQPGDRVLDVCAGPGGKAADIACRAGTVVAADLSLRRSQLVAEATGRLGVRALVLAQDAVRPALRDGFDRILIDAPCSGMGAARRRPELLWRPTREDPARLARLQVRIAAAAAGLLRPGGVLVYSVCTFPVAETDAVCRALMEREPGLRPSAFPGPEGAPVDRARLWPHRQGTDAMFVARFTAD